MPSSFYISPILVSKIVPRSYIEPCYQTYPLTTLMYTNTTQNASYIQEHTQT